MKKQKAKTKIKIKKPSPRRYRRFIWELGDVEFVTEKDTEAPAKKKESRWKRKIVAESVRVV